MSDVSPGPDRADGYPCDVCRRAGGVVTVSVAGGRIRTFCSTDCARIDMAHDATPVEAEAIAKGGEKAGAYLEGIGKTDLARLTGPEWAEFCRILFVATCEDLKRQASDAIPY